MFKPEMTHNDTMIDGYYYRNEAGVAQGPLKDEEFKVLQTRGKILPGMRVWKQKGGNAFRVTVVRQFKIGKIFSFKSFTYFWEIFMSIMILFCMGVVFSNPKVQKDLQKDLDHHWFQKIFLFVLVVATMILYVLSLKKSGERLQASSSDVVCDEV